MAEHYYPGQTIPLGQLAKGWTSSWNNQFVADMVNPPGVPSFVAPGIDYFRPNGQVNGALHVMFNITGEGKAILFYLQAQHQGANMKIWRRTGIGDTEIHKYDSQGGVDPTVYHKDSWEQVFYASTTNWYPADPNEGSIYSTFCALNVTLDLNEYYVIEIGSNSPDDRLGTGAARYVQSMSLHVQYARTPTNDLRADAYPVNIKDAEGFDDFIINEGYGQNFDPSAYDSPVGTAEFQKLYRDAWWSYEPTKSGQLTAAYAVTPTASYTSGFAMQLWEMSQDFSMTMLARTNSTPGSLSYPVEAGHTYFFQIGWTDFPQYQAGGQGYQISVNGPITTELPPDDGGDDGGGDDGGGTGDQLTYKFTSVTPADDVTLPVRKVVVFAFALTVNKTGGKIEVEVDDNPNFTSVTSLSGNVVDSTGLEYTKLTMKKTLTPGKTYHWRYRLKVGNTTTAWLETRDFVIDTQQGVLEVVASWLVDLTVAGPNIWFVYPSSAITGDVVTLYGQNLNKPNAKLYLNDRLTDITSKLTRDASTTLPAIVDETTGTVTVDHDEITFTVPVLNASGAEIKVETP